MHEAIDIETLRQAIIDEIAELDRLRGQARDSRAPVVLDQQSVGRLSRMIPGANIAMRHYWRRPSGD